jgi:HK97 family phage prohead protease
MPIPTPDGEDHDEFINRCMSDETMIEEYEDDDQRLAICETQWDESRSRRSTAMQRSQQERRSAVLQCRVRPGVLSSDGLLKRANDVDLPDIVGHAAVFDDPTELWPGVTEEIAPGAFSRTLKENADVRALRNHEPSDILGRIKAGTLLLTEDDKGLKTRIHTPDTTVGSDLVKSIRRGDVDQMSFAFWIRKEERTLDDEGNVHYRLLDLDLVDVSVVTFPAYEHAIATLDEFRSRAKKALKKPQKSPRKRKVSKVAQPRIAAARQLRQEADLQKTPDVV